MSHLLPPEHRWIDITVPLADVFDQYRGHDHVVVFASGDPLFYGFANTIRRMMPEAEIRLLPTFNSLQMLAHRLLMPYHDMQVVSLTGRPWQELDRALIENKPKIGILTDGTHTPAAIAQRMTAYGFTDYVMHVGEHLGNPDLERVTTLSLADAQAYEATQPNCLIVCGSHVRRMGIPDSEFELLDGRERMITKMPIRLMSLHAMHLERRRTLWDIGSCTGSISIEARLQFPHLHVRAFEVRTEGERLMNINSRRFSAPGIDLHIGNFLDLTASQPHNLTTSQPHNLLTSQPHILTALNPSETPDAVFIGGHGGQLAEIMQRVATCMAPGGCICMNSVTEASRQTFVDTALSLGMTLTTPLHISLNDYNPIDILTCELPS